MCVGIDDRHFVNDPTFMLLLAFFNNGVEIISRVFSIILHMTKIKQPNSRHCLVCGLENPIGLHLHIYETEPGVVESQYTAPEHFQGYPGVLHGGMVAAIIDEMTGRAHMGNDV